jgi:hypothetical protein
MPIAGIPETQRCARPNASSPSGVDYWRARGWPDLCRPMGADDFVCDELHAQIPKSSPGAISV